MRIEVSLASSRLGGYFEFASEGLLEKMTIICESRENGRRMKSNAAPKACSTGMSG